MAAMAADMRNRFVVALVVALIITLYSHIGMEILGLDPPVPFALRNDVWQLLLSLPVIFWCSSIFFRGAVSALRARTLDMMVVVAVGIGTGWHPHPVEPGTDDCQNLAWAVGYNSIALPIAAGVFVPIIGLGLRPGIAALAMSGSSIIVAFNAVLLKRLHLPDAPTGAAPARSASGHPNTTDDGSAHLDHRR